MKHPTDFSKYLADFLNCYLRQEKGLSHNTIRSYSYAFIIFIKYMHDVEGIGIN